MVINKIDDDEKTYLPQYKFLEDEFKDVFLISGLNQTHVKPLMKRVFEFLPEKKENEKGVLSEAQQKGVYPLLNVDSYVFIAELIREKVFLMMGEEIPYTTTAVVDDIVTRDNGVLLIKARILTTQDRYKRMLIGTGAEK